MASPELQIVIDMMRENSPLQGDDLLEMRANLEKTTAALPRPDDVEYTPVDAGGVQAEWTEAPGAEPGRAIVYFHGGGYVLGSLDSHRPLVTRIARAARARVLSVDYRLAPEHPHPAAVEDGVAATRFALAQGVPPSGLALAGDSAGGGLTVATLVALRDGGASLPAVAACMSPWLDLTLSGESVASRAEEDVMVTPKDLRKMAAAYAAGGDPRAPTASPVFADLTGLPPLLLQVGTSEILLDDSTRLAERIREAGGEVELDVWDDMLHVWHSFADILPEAREAIERVAAFLRARWS